MSFDELDRTEQEFAEQLPDALGDAVDALPAHSRDLVSKAVKRGQRLRVVRNAQIGGGTVLALAVLGAVIAGTNGLGALGAHGTATPAADPSSARPSASASGPPAAVSAQDMIRTLEHLLPAGGTFTQPLGRASDDPRIPAMPFAQVTYSTAAGTSQIAVSLWWENPAQATADEACPPVEARPYDTCGTHRLPDGSVVVADRSYTYPSSPSGQKDWTVDLWKPSGVRVSVQEWGGGGEKATKSSAEPLLSTDRLTALADSPQWARAIAAVPDPGGSATATAPPADGEFSGTKMRSVLGSLLDPHLKLSDADAQDGFAQFVLDDGHGRNVVEVNDQFGMNKALATHMGCAPGAAHCQASVLPDGTKVRFSMETGAAGATSWIFDTLHPDGHRVVIRECDSYAENGPVTRTTPLLSVSQLKRIALSPEWGS